MAEEREELARVIDPSAWGEPQSQGGLIMDNEPYQVRALEKADRVLAAGWTRTEGWRAIETAPRDGGAILLIHEEGSVPLTGYWGEHALAWRGAETGGELYPQPTHWAPISPSADLVRDGVPTAQPHPAADKERV